MTVFDTKITEMLGIKYPIIGGTMMWVTNSEFSFCRGDYACL
jgi:NAD(P)H-dependent flavin oxidoreductase YrpB (nitropropane dioxygenase family)